MANKIYVNDEKLMPRRSTNGSAGYDFIAPHGVTIQPHSVSEVIDTGVSVELEKDYVLMCYVRSSYGFKHQVTLVNGTGIIDSDFYPNTIKCILRNDSDKVFSFEAGEKFMQGVLIKYETFDNEIVPTTKRDGGIGSTGK